MIQDYTRYRKTGDVIPTDIYNIIVKNYPDFEQIDYGSFKINKVKSPFIIADNRCDISELNNYRYEIGVKKVKEVHFTGGSIYIEYIKNGDGIIIQGNDDEGFNIFILQEDKIIHY